MLCLLLNVLFSDKIETASLHDHNKEFHTTMQVEREEREMLVEYLRVTYHMLTMMSHDYSGTLPNGYPSLDRVHLKSFPM